MSTLILVFISIALVLAAAVGVMLVNKGDIKKNKEFLRRHGIK